MGRGVANRVLDDLAMPGELSARDVDRASRRRPIDEHVRRRNDRLVDDRDPAGSDIDQRELTPGILPVPEADGDRQGAPVGREPPLEGLESGG
jgi:hypothetical protein